MSQAMESHVIRCDPAHRHAAHDNVAPGGLMCDAPAIAAGAVVVDARQVAKKFCRDLRRSLWYGARDMFSEFGLLRRRGNGLRSGEFWAVQDISLQLRQGEALAIIGRNGAGKTTLLRTVAGLIRPDAGEVRTRGRVAPLLALGAGFNPLLTGRENIFINMAILGLTTRQIRQRFDSVVEFAEIATALDSPVRTYSSGMTARLGFACAVHVVPDVFIVDEALAVGDASFRAKCFRKIADLRRQGVSLLIVSHSVQVLMAVADRALYLEQGKVIASGPTADVLTRYAEDCDNATLRERQGTISGAYAKPPRLPTESPGLDILNVRLESDGRGPGAHWRTGRPAVLRVHVRCHRRISNANLSVAVKRCLGDNEYLFSLNSRDDRREIHLAPGDHEIELRLPSCGLRRGAYGMKLRIDEPQFYLLDMVDWDRLLFRVEADPLMQDCVYYQPREWRTSPIGRDHETSDQEPAQSPRIVYQ
jgi:lipopolysaccharide transport system ATP-binding protein